MTDTKDYSIVSYKRTWLVEAVQQFRDINASMVQNYAPNTPLKAWTFSYEKFDITDQGKLCRLIDNIFRRLMGKYVERKQMLYHMWDTIYWARRIGLRVDGLNKPLTGYLGPTLEIPTKDECIRAITFSMVRIRVEEKHHSQTRILGGRIHTHPSDTGIKALILLRVYKIRRRKFMKRYWELKAIELAKSIKNSKVPVQLEAAELCDLDLSSLPFDVLYNIGTLCIPKTFNPK